MMPRRKITSGAEREIRSLLVQKKTLHATLRHLEWISRYLRVPLWQVKTIAKRDDIQFEDETTSTT